MSEQFRPVISNTLTDAMICLDGALLHKNLTTSESEIEAADIIIGKARPIVINLIKERRSEKRSEAAEVEMVALF